MGLVGHEIIQSRTWLDPSVVEPPNLNYKYAFPITVFDAVRKDMLNENSETLTQILDKISSDIRSKQSIIPAKPANYLVTYAGVAGAVGSIKLSKDIPLDEAEESHDRIPTEKAVCDLIRNLGIDPTNPQDGIRVRWADIVGKPDIYTSLGNDGFGFISQDGMTKIINSINDNIANVVEEHEKLSASHNMLDTKVSDHSSNMNNPHNVTISQIGAASAEVFNNHLISNNPHGITASTIGLDKVNNTSDMDKPISSATQAAIDKINNMIANMTDDVGELSFIIDINYSKYTGCLDLTYRNGSTVSISTPMLESINNIKYDPETKNVIVTNNAGTDTEVSLKELYIRYIGSIGPEITIEIDGNQITGDQIIKAFINAKSITNDHLSDNAVDNRVIKNDSIDTVKIKDLSVTTNKLYNESVITEKIANASIINEKISDRAVDGRTLFSSEEDNYILATLKANSDPVWSQVISSMIAYDAVKSRHIMKYAVTHDKIADGAIGTAKIADYSIIGDKLVNGTITVDKLANASITSDKLAPDLIFDGTPRIINSPSPEANNNEIVDTRWVKNFAKNTLIIETSNINDRAVTGEKIFTSPVRNRVLGVLKASNDPVWTNINNEMMGDDAIGTSNIINKAVSAEKLGDKSVMSNHLTKDAIQSNHVSESAITSEKLYTSHEANRVLAALDEDGHPTYSQVTNPMMAPNSVGGMQVMDGSIPPVKLESSENGQEVMVVGLRGSSPLWSKVMNQMIADRAVDGSKLFTSRHDNAVLGITRSGENAVWLKVTGDMIDKHTIVSKNISENAVENYNMADKAIESRNIADNAILGKHIASGEIKLDSLEPSPVPGRIIGVTGLPYSTPIWTQVSTPMIEDKAVTNDKLFQSKYHYQVLAATQAGTPPEYTMITHQFIVDGTIIPEKLQKDFTLYGTPKLTVSPNEDADDYSLTNTKWVRKFVDTRINEMLTTESAPQWLNKFDFNEIPDHGIDGSKLFTHPYGPRVLGITEANEDVEFILIERDLIVNGAVTAEKIERSVCLLGSPQIEVRPSAYACDGNGNGKQIPDCQWVLDRINDKVSGNAIPGNGSTGGVVLASGSVSSTHLQNRAVTGDKLFTSAVSNRIIAVTDANSSPQYVQANNGMIGDRAVDGRTLFSPEEGNKILAVYSAGDDPTWTQVTSEMIADKAIKDTNIGDFTIKENHIDNGSITARMLASEQVVAEVNIFDQAVTHDKIADDTISYRKLKNGSITTEKINDKAVNGSKLADELILPQNSTVKNSDNYDQRAIRNITISPNKPRGGRSGDIWFRFV